MKRENLFLMYALAGAGAIALVSAGCTSAANSGGGSGPNPTPAPIPAGEYYVNAGTNPNKAFGMSSAPIAGGGLATPLPNSPYTATGQDGTGGAPYGIAISGNFLFEVNATAGSVSTFTINADNSLTYDSTANTDGTMPAGICVSPNGTLAAVAERNTNEIETFTIGGGGALTSANHLAATNGLMGPIDCAFAPDNGGLYVTNSAVGGGVSAFKVNGAGTLTANNMFAVGTGSLQGIAVTSTTPAYAFAACTGCGGIEQFAVAAGDALVPVAFQNTALGPYGVAVSPDGQNVYIASAGARALDGFHISAGSLSHLVNAPYQTQATQSAYIAVSSSGNLLVDLSPPDLAVTLFKVNSDGSLGYAPTNLYGIPNLPSGTPAAAVVVR